MSDQAKKPGAWSAMLAGAGVVARRQRVLWWLFLVNFILGSIAASPLHKVFGDVLDYSLASRALADHFDVSAYLELVNSPQFSLGIYRNLPLLTGILFALVVLFVEPGVIQEFRQCAGINVHSARQTAGEFFGTCGAFLLRLMRLLLWSFVPLLFVGVFVLLAGGYIGLTDEGSPSEVAGYYATLLAGFLIFLVLAAVRVWINISEVDLVASGETQTRRTLFVAARKITFGNFGKLYTIQLVTSIAVVVVTLLGLAIWAKFVPPGAVSLAFVVSEITLLVLLACRLWQKASLVVWYERWAALQPKPIEEVPPELVAMGGPVESGQPEVPERDLGEGVTGQ